MNNNPTVTPPPLRVVIRQQREKLYFSQAQVAEALRLTPEAIGNWERGTRRVELGKIPRLAAILQLDGPALCGLALYEYFPALAACLFDGGSGQTKQTD